MSAVTIVVNAVLFDMDGTLIDSTPGVLQAWKNFAVDYNLEDSDAIAHATHGRRLYDTLKEYCGITDQGHLMAEIDRFEDQVVQGGPIALPGAVDLISKLSSHPSTKSKWTIVTSGKKEIYEAILTWLLSSIIASNRYAPRALHRSGIPVPALGIITSNDVLQGKPHPAPYLTGALRCGTDPKKCLVVEDAISGLYSGRAAGSLTLAVCTSTPRATIADSGANPDYIVADLTKVKINVVDENLEITIDQSCT